MNTRFITMKNLIRCSLSFAIALNFSACTKSSDSSSDTTQSLVTQSRTLNVQTKVIDESGVPVANAMIVVQASGLDPSTVGTTSADGSVTVNFSSAATDRMIAVQKDAQIKLLAKLVEPGSTRLLRAGVSEQVDLRQRGDVQLPPITAKVPAALKGVVILQNSLTLSKPGEGTVVEVGGVKVTAGADGGFELYGIMPGDVTAKFTLSGYAPLSLPLTLASGEVRILKEAQKLYLDGIVYGEIVPMPVTDFDTLIAVGHPYLRQFEVKHSPNAKYIRFSSLAQGGAGIDNSVPWVPVQSTMEYEFSNPDGQVLQAELAETKDGRPSSGIITTTFIVSPVGPSKGFTIGDGSGVTQLRTIPLYIDVPSNAYRMNVSVFDPASTRPSSNEIKDFTLLPAPVYILTLSQLDTESKIIANGYYNVRVRFTDPRGNFSETYVQTVYYEAFPRAGAEVFTINGGAPVSPVRTVSLNINVPPNARRMRFTDSDLPDLFAQPEYDAAPTHTFVFTYSSIGFNVNGPILGIRTLRMQFIDGQGAFSPVYSQQIRIDPSQSANTDFAFVSGEYSPLRSVQLALSYPPYVTSALITDDTGFAIDTRVAPIVPFLVTGFGSHNVSVVYRTIDGDRLIPIVHHIFIDPFPPASYGFDFVPGTVESISDPILGNQILSRSRVLKLQVTPPPGARYFSVDFYGNVNWDQWMPLTYNPDGSPAPTSFDIPFENYATDLKEVFVRFKSTDLLVSPFISKIVYYDPFYAPPTAIQLADGATTTNSINVKLGYTFGAIPASEQIYVRYCWSIDQIDQVSYTLVTGPSQMIQLPSATLGHYNIYVQFRIGETKSGVFTSPIELVP